MLYKKTKIAIISSLLVLTAHGSNQALANEDEISANELGEAVKEIFHAHGLIHTTVGSTHKDGDKYTIDTISAKNGTSLYSLIINNLTIAGISDEEGNKTWLGFNSVKADSIIYEFNGIQITATKPEFSKLKFLNKNKNENRIESQYEYIEGAFSGFKLNTAKALDVKLSINNTDIMLFTDPEVVASNWMLNSNFPTKLNTSISGLVLANDKTRPLISKDNAFQLKTKTVIDDYLAYLTTEVSLKTSDMGEILSEVSFRNMGTEFYKNLELHIATMLTGEKVSNQNLFQDMLISRFSIAAKNTSWLKEGYLSSILKEISSEKSLQAIKIIENHLGSSKEGAVVKINPESEISLPGLLMIDNNDTLKKLRITSG